MLWGFVGNSGVVGEDEAGVVEWEVFECELGCRGVGGDEGGG